MSNGTPDTVIDYGPRGQVLVVQDAETLARRAAAMALDLARDAVHGRQAAYIALSGGSTPKRMGELFAEPEFRNLDTWRSMHVYWGDERWTDLHSDEHNAGVALRTFLTTVPTPPDQIHPMPTGKGDPHDAALAYERLLRDTVPLENGLPRFDLIVLGMGDDGHTASLFPHTAAIQERQRLVVANIVPQLDTTRLTLTSPVLNAARNVVFLVGGQGKASRLAEVLEGPIQPEALPAQLVQPVDGSLTWLVDREAASALTGNSFPS